MFKTLFLFISCLFANVAPNDDYLTIIVAHKEAETVLAEAEGYRLLQNENGYVLSTRTGTWRREVELDDDYRLAEHNGRCLLFYRRAGILHLLACDKDGNTLYHSVLFTNPIGARWDVYCENDIYVAGGVTDYQDESFLAAADGKELGGEDGFVARFDGNFNLVDLAVYGGERNECFTAITGNGGRLFLAGHKVPGGGGDFGNGGQYNDTVFVAILDQNMEIENYRVLASIDAIVAFNYYKDRLFLVLTNRVYKFAEDLTTLHREDFRKRIISAHFSELNRLALFTATEGYIYNTYTFVCEYVFTYPTATSVRIRADAVTLLTAEGGLLLDVACLQDFRPPEYHCPDITYRDEVHTLFGPARLLREESEPYFDPAVYGQYQRKYIYATAAGLEIAITRKMEVQLEANVDEDGIYPLGYRLRFTGIAYLDGGKIINNHPVEAAGEHLLELRGASGEVCRVRFSVASNQLRFTDHAVQSWDIETGIGSLFSLCFACAEIGDCEIISIIVNGEEVDDLLVDRGKKTIDARLRAPADSGIYYYRLEKINYKRGNDYFSHNLDQTIAVNVLKPAPELRLIATGGFEFTGELDDAAATARYFAVVAMSNRDEVRKKYSLANNNIYLSGLDPDDEYRVRLCLVYQVGNRIYKEIELLEVIICGQSECKIGEIEILEAGESLKRFQINLKKSGGLLTVSRVGEILYRRTKKTPTTVVTAVAGAMIAAAVAFGIKKRVARWERKQTLSSK